jgi:hypothetical protein
LATGGGGVFFLPIAVTVIVAFPAVAASGVSATSVAEQTSAKKAASVATVLVIAFIILSLPFVVPLWLDAARAFRVITDIVYGVPADKIK